jgi:hypothetical protein
MVGITKEFLHDPLRNPSEHSIAAQTGEHVRFETKIITLLF